MLRSLKSFSLVFGLFGLAACGGGGGGGSNFVPDGFERPAVENASFASLEVEADRLLTQNISLRQDENRRRGTPIPTSGTAVYVGIGAFINDTNFKPATNADAQDDIVREAEMLSQVRLTADFGRGGGVSGEAFDFFQSDGDAVEGTLTFTNAQIERTRFRGEISGNLTIDGVERQLTGSSANGLFYNPQVKSVRVGFDEISSVPTAGGGASETLRAVFLADRSDAPE